MNLWDFLDKYSSALRVRETILLTGFFIMGAIFSIDKLSELFIIDLCKIAAIAFCLNSGLYALNAYTGKIEDRHNIRLINLAKTPFSFYLKYFCFTLPITLMASWFFNAQFLKGIVLLLVLGGLYSIPILKLKNGPIGGTIVHFLYQIIAFNSAFAVFDQPSWASLLISIYFALLFSSGHIHHQAIDYEADMLAKIRTGAVKWGLSRAYHTSFILAVVSALYWLFLYFMGYLDLTTMLLFIAAFCFHFTLYKVYKNKFENSNNRISYRNYYRICYLMAGLGLVLIRL